MNFVTLHCGGNEIRVNLARIEDYYHATNGRETTIKMSSGGLINVRETMEQIDKFVNGMAAWQDHVPGCTYGETKPEQDARTKLLIEAIEVIESGGMAPTFVKAIRKEVGEAAIEQYYGVKP